MNSSSAGAEEGEPILQWRASEFDTAAGRWGALFFVVLVVVMVACNVGYVLEHPSRWALRALTSLSSVALVFVQVSTIRDERSFAVTSFGIVGLRDRKRMFLPWSEFRRVKIQPDRILISGDEWWKDHRWCRIELILPRKSDRRRRVLDEVQSLRQEKIQRHVAQLG